MRRTTKTDMTIKPRPRTRMRGLGADLGRPGKKVNCAFAAVSTATTARGRAKSAFGLQPVPHPRGDAPNNGLGDREARVQARPGQVESLQAELSGAEGDSGTAAGGGNREVGAGSWPLAAELFGANRALAEIEVELVDSRAAFERADKGVDLIREAKPSLWRSLFRRAASANWTQELSTAIALRADCGPASRGGAG